jgi:hypothetical protein
MINVNKIKENAFVDELQKISGIDIEVTDSLSAIKKAAFVDELKKIACGVGKNIIKTAEDFTPPKWEGVSGFHKAVSEDPKRYQFSKIENDVKSIALASPIALPIFAIQHKAYDKAGTEYINSGDYKNKTNEEINKIDKEIRKKVARKFGPILGLSLIGGSIIANQFLKNKYLENKGISKKPFGDYSFNEEAQKKYLNKEGNMINFEQIKEAAYKDEINKIATLHYLGVRDNKDKSGIEAETMKLQTNKGKRNRIISNIAMVGGGVLGAAATRSSVGILAGVLPGAIAKHYFQKGEDKKVQEYLNKKESDKKDMYDAFANRKKTYTIKEAAYKDELNKIATRNPVAVQAIKGGTIGAGVGGVSTGLLAMKLIKKLKIGHKNPIVAASTLAGAVAGAEAGGRAGAFIGGGQKGVYNMYEPLPGH